MKLKQFKESDFDSLSSLMVRDDIGQLVLGARGKVITLSLDDITNKTSQVRSGFYVNTKCVRCLWKVSNHFAQLHKLFESSSFIPSVRSRGPSALTKRLSVRRKAGAVK